MTDERDDFEGQDSGPVMPVDYSGYEEPDGPPTPSQPLTPAQHIARGKELICEVERARSRGYDDATDIAAWHADSMLASAHITAAVGEQQLMLIEQEMNPVREASPSSALGGAKAHHERAAQFAETYLPSYIGALLAGTLREHHSLPSIIQKQDEIAGELIEWLANTEADVKNGSVDDVLAKLEAIGTSRGGAMPVYVVQQDHFVRVSSVDHTSSFGETFGNVETPGVVIS